MRKSLLRLSIPDTVQFSELELSFVGSDLAFNWEPIEKICGHNGLNIAIFKHSPESNVCDLLTHWYTKHRESGGALDPVMEEYLAEVQAEEKVGLIVEKQHARDQ